MPNIDYSRAPRHEDAIRQYVEDGRPPGHFLRAVLRDSLTDAIGHADSTNRDSIGEWVTFVYNELPQSCWGSRDAVEAWVGAGGLDDDDR